jgi:hypothetical protein
MNAIALLATVSIAACLSSANARETPKASGMNPGSVELQRAQEYVAEITSVEDYLRHLEQQKLMFDSGELGRASRIDRQRLESASNQIRRLLQGQHSAIDLAPRQQVALFNAQEEFDAVLLDYSDPLVCTRERSTGSRLVSTTCRRRSEINRRRDADQADFQQMRGLAHSETGVPTRPGDP